MSTAREALLDAALSALAGLPWSGVRMVDVALAAGVSRQTLYNEFGSKDGLARALVRREADVYLRGVDRVLAERPQASPTGSDAGGTPIQASPTGSDAGGTPIQASPTGSDAGGTPIQASPTGSDAGGTPIDPTDRLVHIAEWTVGAARSSALVRALLTGCWSERLPAPSRRTTATVSPVPAQRRADAGVPGPAELLAAVRDRACAALEKEVPGADPAELWRFCETAVRLGLSYVVARAGTAEGPSAHIRAVLAVVPVRPTGRT